MRTAFFVILFLNACTAALAFGTINFLGQNSEHEKITRLAFKGLGFDRQMITQFAGRGGTAGAVSAPDLPGDLTPFNPIAHCDNGDFLEVEGYPVSRSQSAAMLTACRDYIFNNLQQAIETVGRLADASGKIDNRQIPAGFACALKGLEIRAKCQAISFFGKALHASQDFYSHTNWTDIPAPGPLSAENPPGLGQEGPAPFIDPALRGEFPEGLVSGCFQGIPETLYCLFEDGRSRIRHRALSKDVGRIDMRSETVGAGTTERGKINQNFKRAVEAAIADTREKWIYFENTVIEKYGGVRGLAILCAMKNFDPAQSCG